MPIYEFKCLKCSKLYEISRAIEFRDNPISCQECKVEMERIFSGFSLAGKSNSYNFSEKQENPQSIPPTNHPSGTLLEIGGKNITVENSSFKNAGTGISMPQGTKVEMKDNKFENVSTPIQVKHK